LWWTKKLCAEMRDVDNAYTMVKVRNVEVTLDGNKREERRGEERKGRGGQNKMRDTQI
jgi:hypothetical protein